MTLRTGGEREPLFLVHPVGGEVTNYVGLANLLDDDRPIHAIEDQQLFGTESSPNLQEMAGRYIELIRQLQPHGPYHLGGWSFGGILALEMAGQLQESGETVAIVVAIDSLLQSSHRPTMLELLTWFVLEAGSFDTAALPDVDFEALQGLDREALENVAVSVLDQAGLAPPETHADLRTRMRVFITNFENLLEYQPRTYDDRVVLITARDAEEAHDLSAWRAFAPGLEHLTTPGDHYTMFSEPNAPELAESVRRCLKT